jgi:hypothetical protein
MTDLIVRLRTGGKSYRIKESGSLTLNAKSLGSEWAGKKENAVDSDWTFSYDDLIPYIGTTSHPLLVKYADQEN